MVHQIMTDIPSYEVMNQHRQSQVLHQNQLLLIASEVGIPLRMGSCHTWDRCTSPTHARLPLLEVMKRGCHKQKMVRPSPNGLPVKLPCGGKMGSCSLYHEHLLERLLRMGEDHRKGDLAADLQRNMYVRQRDDIYTH